MLAYFAQKLPQIVNKMDKKKTLSGRENSLEVLRNPRLVRTVHQLKKEHCTSVKKGVDFHSRYGPFPVTITKEPLISL